MQSNKSVIRLLLVEDNRILREGIKYMLRPYNDLQVITSSGTCESRIVKIGKLKPNVVLLDFDLRTQNSLRMIEIMRKGFPEVKVIVIALVPVRADILRFIKAGASGFVLKDASLDEFLTTIRAVAEGEKVLPGYLTESLFSQIKEYSFKNGKSMLKHKVFMTKREREITELIGRALTNEEIARDLNISVLTVKSHVHNILEKLELHSRLEIANLSFINYI